MKNLFSERYGYKKPKELLPNEMPESLRNRLWNFLSKEINEEKIMVRDDHAIYADRNKVIEVIWDKFFKEDLEKLKKFWIESYI